MQFECEITITELRDGYWGTNALFLITSDVYDEINGGLVNKSYSTNAVGFNLNIMNRDKSSPSALPVMYIDGTEYANYNNTSKTLPKNTPLIFKVSKSESTLKLQIIKGGEFHENITR